MGTGAGGTDERHPVIPRAPTAERFGAPVVGSIPTIVRSFKTATTRHYRKILMDPDARLWQRNYYEHIIRDETDLARIRDYIQTNPVRGKEDRENPAK